MSYLKTQTTKNLFFPPRRPFQSQGYCARSCIQASSVTARRKRLILPSQRMRYHLQGAKNYTWGGKKDQKTCSTFPFLPSFISMDSVRLVGSLGGKFSKWFAFVLVTVRRMWALSHRATFWRGCSLSHYNFGGSDRAAASPGAISLKLNLQDNLRGGQEEKKPNQ